MFVCRYQYVSVSHLRLENYRGSNLIGIIKVHLKVHICCDECVTRRDVWQDHSCQLSMHILFLKYWTHNWKIYKELLQCKRSQYCLKKNKNSLFKNSLTPDETSPGETNCIHGVARNNMKCFTGSLIYNRSAFNIVNGDICDFPNPLFYIVYVFQF